MEAKTTKMIAAVAVIVMCAAGLVGAGYAYTASTINEDNDVTSEYVKLTQTGTGAYKFANNLRVYYDTANATNAETFKYRLADARAVVGANNEYTAVKLGNTINLNVDDVTRTPASLNCTFATSGFAIQHTNYVFILKITSATDPVSVAYKVVSGNDTWSPNNTFTITYNSGYKALSVDVYYGYATDDTDDDTKDGWLANAPETTPLNNATITFTATVDSVNPGIVMDHAAGEVTVAEGTSHTLQLGVTKLGAVDGTVTWVSADTTKATVSDSGLVTGVAVTTGPILVIATLTTDAGVQYTTSCQITVVAEPAAP